MMARIEAGERLKTISDGAMAAGNLTRQDAWRINRRLMDSARGKHGRAAKATPAVLAGMGIGASIALSEAAQQDVSDG